MRGWDLNPRPPGYEDFGVYCENENNSQDDIF
ncbi:hypothetical protein CMTB2_04137 [Caminibacter mediatlanticus TB-2]|uniref:Uncharacterized protein n=1 Tax=Caminibacter mediatlanticus TB-2 TaxID=391592 RepID=A0AAI9F0M8_9BACT|nr:hypothetical protein CMTB2_04137 [Caminibacter mediatlanticus TB-2]